MPKRAHVTPSQFAKIMAPRGFGKVAMAYADELVLGMLGVETPEINSKHFDWGNAHEPIAIDRYIEDTFYDVQKVEKSIHHQELDYVCGKPDGLIGKSGILEVKCPSNPVNHLNNITDASQYDQYIWQIQGYLWITERQWCDFVSFDPRFPYEKQIAIHRIQRNDEDIEKLSERVHEFWEIVQNKFAQI